MKCMYCSRVSINYSMWVVRRAIKPKGSPYRWKEEGYCCDECEASGKPISIEYVPPKDHPVERFAANLWKYP